MQDLSNEQIIEQIRATGDDDRELIGQLYKQNTGLLRRFIRPYVRAGMESDDAMQQAYLGLVQAVEHYDETTGNTFTTCLCHWVRSAVGRELQNTAHTKRLPAHMQERIGKYKRICREYKAETGKQPNDNYLCFFLGVSPEQLKAIRLAINESEILSLSEPIKEDSAVTFENVVPDPADMIGDIIEQASRAQDARELWAEVDRLEYRQAEALRRKYVNNLSITQVAEELGLTKSQAIRTLNKGCKRLRHSKKVERIAQDAGYSTRDLFGGSLSSFKTSGTSIVEDAALRKIESLLAKGN